MHWILSISFLLTAHGAYFLSDDFSGPTFFNNFNFMTNTDYSHGYVNYLSYDQATAEGLISAGNQILIKSDSTKVVASDARGRDSLRIESKKSYNGGLFIMDLEHMPTGCGTWPAYWTYGPSWPNSGDLSILAVVAEMSTNQVTAHTKDNCTLSSEDPNSYTGNLTSPNCAASAGNGCTFTAGPNTSGAPFNQNKGGVYATQWQLNDGINIWFWNRSSIPADITNGKPDPTTWGKPISRFAFGPDCTSDHWANNVLVIDTNFCGDWAGNTFQYDCPNIWPTTCQQYVQNNPSAFTEAYWTINYLRVYQQQTNYVLTDDWSGSNFFSYFNFMTNDDYSHGYVNYVSQSQAQSEGLISAGTQILIKSDDKNVVPSTARGRDSIRIESKKNFSNGLFIIDLEHLPTGCGTWPAFWTYGPSWPVNGEIDIIEVVARMDHDQTTLHTNSGCNMADEDKNSFTGNMTSTDCSGGCSIEAAAGSSGTNFNSNKGGVYATQWEANDGINVWFWPRASIPSDVADGKPQPNGWGKPYARFAFSPSCPSTHFAQNVVVINTDFCGDWAGNTFQWDCPDIWPTTCQQYVQNNPSAFSEAYWTINYVRVYQNSAYLPTAKMF